MNELSDLNAKLEEMNEKEGFDLKRSRGQVFREALTRNLFTKLQFLGKRALSVN